MILALPRSSLLDLSIPASPLTLTFTAQLTPLGLPRLYPTESVLTVGAGGFMTKFFSDLSPLTSVVSDYPDNLPL